MGIVLHDSSGVEENLISVGGDLPAATVANSIILNDDSTAFHAEEIDIEDSVETGNANEDINIDDSAETDNVSEDIEGDLMTQPVDLGPNPVDLGPKLKTTKMEDDQNGRRPKWKTTKMEDDQNGR